MEKKTRWDVRAVEEWEAVFREQTGSHLTAVKFCRERGINYAQFLYVRGKLHKKADRSLVVSRPSGLVPVAPSRGFIPISVVGAGSSVRVRFPRGLTLETDELPPVTWVADVMRCLADEGSGPC